jgi:glycerol-3-phosphate dehydrogenase
MHRNLPALADGVFDLLIIGGGIFGAGIARDAALRGLRVALVEQSDFASGTSSRSSKLIHGGFRYLEQRAFSLVAESTRERRILQDIAPHRVRPLPFLLPVYRGDPRPLWLMRLGMTLYDVLALYRNTAAHRKFSPARTLATEPGLDPKNLRGAIRFYDCQEDDARFCIDNLLHASELGALCANYCEVTGLAAKDGRIVSATVTDRLGAGSFDIRARAFINAAGPWVERVAGLLPPAAPGGLPHLSPTKGVHILLPRLTQTHGIFFQGRRDGRMLFILPWNDCTMVGTTDTDFKGDPADVRADASDVEYLLAEVRALFPSSNFTASDVITTFAGIRPLLKSDASTPTARSREHSILRRGENLLSIAGGKYTTYRLIAEQVVDAAYDVLGSRPAECRTARTPLPNHRPVPTGDRIAEIPDVYASDVTHAVREEMATTVEDVMRRRTGMALSRSGGPATAERVAHIMTNATPQDAERIDASLRAYIEEWGQSRPGRS